MFIAVDDTDSRDGMCTTFLATELIAEFEDYDLLDHPRLVRLNPNVPWKTRGNGAIVVTLGKGEKKERKIGEIGEEVSLFEGISKRKEDTFQRVKKVVEEWSEFDSEKTNPGFVIADKRPPRRFYEKAVRDVVELDEVLDYLDKEELSYKGYGEKRGLIGALSALSWTPEDRTYELLTYRRKEKWGEHRRIPEEDVIELDQTLKKTFDNYDHEEKKQAVAPNSPCPVLYGVRGEDPEELEKALNIIGGEVPERWITFLTNQGTDDHIQDLSLEEIKPWTSSKITGKVRSESDTIEGGHVFFEIENKKGKITAAAYEPTKGFRNVVKNLIQGDKVELWGGIRKDPITLNIEKMKILQLKNKIVKVSNPKCPECGRSMSSMGTDAGYRCKNCRTKADEDEAKRKKVERELNEGWYETPVSARRHLSKPLARLRDNDHSG
ncbi:MAG: DUF1743 domain-containing protein [Candidatus Thermoplasmatota archaeon]|nr:DUF1743 domain-containing protein [Candidatus Thermoplasmatota archaeon]